MAQNPDIEPRTILALDAMGVIYSVGDDTGELLLPFIAEHGGTSYPASIEAHYVAASLGEITTEDFWHRVGVSPDLEDEYLALHQLSPGVEQFLDQVQQRVAGICCLSNDVSAWSLKLRERFGLDRWISTWVISADVGARKPSPRIYEALIESLGVEPRQIVFVDDRAGNLNAAAAVGIRTVLFDPEAATCDFRHGVAREFEGIVDLLLLGGFIRA